MEEIWPRSYSEREKATHLSEVDDLSGRYLVKCVWPVPSLGVVYIEFLYHNRTSFLPDGFTNSS
jgi:hypothetical protein